MHPIPATDAIWHAENLETGQPGDVLDADYMNSLDAELGSILDDAEIERDPDQQGQIRDAINVLIGRKTEAMREAVNTLWGAYNLLVPSAANGIQIGELNKKADLNTFTAPGVYGVWNSETTLDQIKGYWAVRVTAIGEEILQECTDYWDGQRRYLRRYKAGVWQETRIVDANYLQTALANMNSSEDFERRVMAIISAYNANPVGKFAYFASESGEALREVGGVRVWLRCNVDVSFDAATYPMLAIIYPSLVVPAQADQTREVSTGTDNDTETETYGYVFIRALDA